MNFIALEFRELEQKESYRNYVQIKGNAYGFIQTTYSLLWQALTALKVITSLEHIEIGVIIFINCCIQVANLVFMNKNFNMQRRIAIFCLLVYVIVFSIALAHLSYENPDKFSYQELMHISFNMSLVFHNMSLIVKNWFFRSIILFIPIVIIPLSYEDPSESFIPILVMSFVNILLTFMLVYFEELKMMVAYDQEFKLRHQLQEWKNLIEKYIPHEIVIVSKVPITDVANDNVQIKQVNKAKDQNNLLSTQPNQHHTLNDKLDHALLKIGQNYHQTPAKVNTEKKYSLSVYGNGYQNSKRNSQDMFLHNGMMLFPSEQRNLTQSLFQDTHQDASLSNIKELERLFDEQQRQMQSRHAQKVQQHQIPQSEQITSEKYLSNAAIHKSQFNKNHATKEDNTEKQEQKSFNFEPQIKQNQFQIQTLNQYIHGEEDQHSHSIQQTNNNSSQNNVMNFDNTSFINSELSKHTTTNNIMMNNPYFKQTSQTNQMFSVISDQNQFHLNSKRNLSLKINGIISQQSNTPGRNMYLDPNAYSLPQSSNKINFQYSQQKDFFSNRPESLSLENNELEIINNYKDIMKERKQQQENHLQNQRHQSFNMINTNKYNQWSTIVPNKKMSFNSFNQLSQQGSISININPNQNIYSQNNIESNHTRSPSYYHDNNQNINIDSKTPTGGQIGAAPSYNNILPPYVLSEEVIIGDRKNAFLYGQTPNKNQTEDNINRLDYLNSNRTFNVIPSRFSDDNESSLSSDIEGKDYEKEENYEDREQDTPQNKKQHFNKELMSSGLIQEDDPQDTNQNRQITNYNDNLTTARDQGDMLIETEQQSKKSQKLATKNGKSQAPMRQKSQTLQEFTNLTTIAQNILEKQDQDKRCKKPSIQAMVNKNQQAEKLHQQKKPSNISIKLIKQQNGGKVPEPQQKVSISLQAEESYKLKEVPYKITFPQINTRFAQSFASEEDDIKKRLKNIVKDNVSIYERIQEYFQNNDMNVQRSTSLQISGSHNEMKDSKQIGNSKNKNQINQNLLANSIKLKANSVNDKIFKNQASDNKNGHAPQYQQDTNKKENYFEFLGCYDSISKKYYDIKIIPVFFENTNQSLMIHFNDISDSVMNQRLQSAQKYKDLMLASISHDLRTPLNFIKLMTEKCEEEESLDIIKGILPMIKSNCEMLMSLINDILDHQQMQEGKFRLVTSNFSVNTLFDEIYQLFKIQSEEKNIKIVRKIDQNISISSDKNRLKQILINLMSNAIKFTQKGEIKISARLTNDCNLLALSVKDSGCGIPQNLQEKLFQVYSTFDHAGGTNKHGVGLGLSLCRGLVAQLGPYNKIDLASKQGKGSKFSFKIWSNLEGHQKNQIKLSLDMDRILNESGENSKSNSVNNAKEANNDLDKIHEVQDDDQQSSIGSSEKGDSTLNNQIQFDEIPDDKNNLNLTPDSRVRCYTSFSSQKFHKKGQDIIHIPNNLTSPPNQNGAGKSTFLKHHAPLSLQQKNDQITEDLRDILSHFQKLLIVDDTIFNIIALKIWLKNFQIQIDTANDGREAYQKYQKNQYDLILMDIQMPIMDGYQSTKLIRQYEQQNSLQRSVILIVSAFTSQDDVNKCINVGADDHISKPIERPIFCQVLKKHLQVNKKGSPKI